MLITGSGLTVTSTEALPVHPLASVTVTEYVPVVVTVMLWVVAPVLHR